MNIFRKNNILIDGLLADTYNFLQSTYNQTSNVFTVASAWGQILFVLQNISQLILYFIEDSITELNMEEATRDYSVRSLARIAGFDPGRSAAAQGEVTIAWNKKNGDVGGGAVILNNNTVIRCQQNGKTYSLRFGSPKVTIPLVAGNVMRVKAVEGTFVTTTLTGTGNYLQSYSISSKAGTYVDQFYIDVYVNDEKWRRYDSLYDIPLDARGYLVKSGISPGIDIYFGNSNFGRVPQAGSVIRVEYLQNQGRAGNVVSTKDNPITFAFNSTGTDLFGSEVDLNLYIDLKNEIDPSFGTEPESIALIRLVAPKTSRSFVFANAENYEVFLSKLGIFSQIQAFSTFDDDYLDDDNIVYLYLVPDITLDITSNMDYFSVPISDFLLTAGQKTKIENLIQGTGSMIATTVIKIVQPVIARYVLNVILITFEGFDPETIKQTIRKRVSDYMIGLKRRDRIPKSDFIAIIEAIPGVDSVSVFFSGQKNEENQTMIRKLTNVSQAQLDEVIGMDQFGDIIIGRNELVLLRGGWTDRHGTAYNESIVQGKPGPLNINISSVVPQNYRSSLNADLKSQIIAQGSN
jgi:hypothetical protein